MNERLEKLEILYWAAIDIDNYPAAEALEAEIRQVKILSLTCAA